MTSTYMRRSLKTAAIGGALGEHAHQLANRYENHVATSIGRTHPAVAAVLAVQRAIAHLAIPAPQVRYAGMHRLSGSGGHGIHEGVIDVQLSFRTARGVGHTVSIPVQVRNGQLLSPSVLVDSGVRKLLAQPTIDEMIGRVEMPNRGPARQMFSPPGIGGSLPFWSTASVVRRAAQIDDFAQDVLQKAHAILQEPNNEAGGDLGIAVRLVLEDLIYEDPSGPTDEAMVAMLQEVGVDPAAVDDSYPIDERFWNEVEARLATSRG